MPSSNQNTVKHQKSASSRVFISNQPENAPQVLNNTAGGARGKQTLGIPDVLIDRKQLQKKNQRGGNRSALGFNNHNNSSQLNYSSIQDKIFTSMTGAPIKEKAKQEKASRSIKDGDIDSNQNLKLTGLRSGHQLSSEERFFEESENQQDQPFGKMVPQYQILSQMKGENASQNVDDDYKSSSMNKM